MFTPLLINSGMLSGMANPRFFQRLLDMFKVFDDLGDGSGLSSPSPPAMAGSALDIHA